MNNANRELGPLLEKLREIGAYMRSRWPGRSSVLLEKSLKSDCSLVTEIDLESNRRLVDFFKDLDSSIGILSEEIPETLEEGKASRAWIIDPLDGTEIFARGERGYAIFCGERRLDQLVSGAAYYPEFEIMLEVTRFNGGTINGSPLVCRKSVDQSSLRYFIEDLLPEKLLDQSGSESFEVRSMAFRAFCLGEIDFVVMRHPIFNVWDFAPWALACEEAGGIVCDEQGRRISWDKRSLKINALVISTKAAYSYVDERIRACGLRIDRRTDRESE